MGQKQSKDKVLAVKFACLSTIEVGNPVAMSGDLAVALQSGAAPVDLIGNVCAHLDDALECTVATRFRERRDDREAPAAVTVGPFVFDADQTVINYVVDTHDPAALAGVVIKLPDPASLIGTVQEPYHISTGSNDKFKVHIGDAIAQTFTLDDDETATAAEIAAKINATATDFSASAFGGRLKLTANDPWKHIVIEAVAADCYAALGFTAGTTDAPTTIETLEK